MLRCFFSIILFLSFSVAAMAQDDTTEVKAAPKVIERNGHQLRVGIDIIKPIVNSVMKGNKTYELEADYYLKRDLYGVIEGGWGSANFDSSYLKYNSSNTFFRIGINKSMLRRLMPG